MEGRGGEGKEIGAREIENKREEKENYREEDGKTMIPTPKEWPPQEPRTRCSSA